MIITIAFPSRGVVDPAFAVALRLLEIPVDSGLSVMYLPGADVSTSRNKLAEKAKDVADYIFFVDDDVLPPMNAITKLLSHNKDIVSGLYFAKQEPHFPQIFLKNKENKERYDSIENYKRDSLIEIDACGGGCVLIKSDVFKKLRRPYFQFIPQGEDHPRKGEDFFFCEKAKEAGFEIYCDTSIICKHIGTKFIGPQHWDISLEQIEKLKNQMGEEKFNEWKKKFYDQ